MSWDTSARRPATGLDAGARGLILNAVFDATRYDHQNVVVALFVDRYATIDDYMGALGQVHGDHVSAAVQQAMGEAAADAEFPVDFQRRDPNEAAARALLLEMPEGDFRLAIEQALRSRSAAAPAAPRITAICRARGVPWAFSGSGFQWIGDADVDQYLVIPAVTAVNDPRFAGGVRSEFESARAALRVGTPQGRKQAIHEAGCAVESAMKVVLDQHAVSYEPTSTAHPLFKHLVDADIVPRRLERLVLAASTPRNKTAGHGAGAIAHNPEQAEAESVVASAAGAISYLRSRLPEARTSRFKRRR